MDKTLASQFDMQTRLFNNVLDNINDKEAETQANGKSNHIKWLAGHLVNSRLMLKDMAGLPADPRFDAFDKEMVTDQSKNYLSLEEIKTKWNEIAGPISNSLKNMPEEALEAKGPFMSPIGDESVRGLVGFLMHHEAYHLGQMGILRKVSDKEAMSYR